MYKLLLVIFLLSSSMLKAQSLLVVMNKDTTRFESDEQYMMAHTSREGYWIIFGEKDRQEEGLYVNNMKQGKWVKYHHNGKKCEEISYSDDRASGRMVFYYDNGNVREEGTWIDRHWVGEYKLYYETGIPQYVWQFDDQGTRTGVQMYFHENGNTMIEGEWATGQEKGVIKEYYDDGSVKSEKSFEKGKVDSASVRIYEPKVMVPLVKEVAATIPVDSLKQFKGNGYFVTKNKQNKKDYDGIWKNGKYQDGNKYVYDAAGNLVKILIYRNGVKVGEKIPD